MLLSLPQGSVSRSISSACKSFSQNTYLEYILWCICTLLPMRRGDIGKLCDKAASLLIVFKLLFDFWTVRLELQ
jgi:hypothetical protein